MIPLGMAECRFDVGDEVWVRSKFDNWPGAQWFSWMDDTLQHTGIIVDITVHSEKYVIKVYMLFNKHCYLYSPHSLQLKRILLEDV